MTPRFDKWTASLIVALVLYISALYIISETRYDLLHELSTPVVAALLAALAYRIFTRADAQRRGNVAYANAWRGVLLELWNALGRMKNLSEDRIEHPDRIRFYQIRFVDGVRLAYLRTQEHPECAKRVYGIYNGIEHFMDGHARSLEYLNLAKSSSTVGQRRRYWDLSKMWMENAAIWVAQHRHHKMIDDFEYLLIEYNQFCQRAHLTNLELTGVAAEKLLPKYWCNE